MLRLRCYLFGKIIRERRDRMISQEEGDFLDRHRQECIDCRVREAMTGCSLDILKSATTKPSEDRASRAVQDTLEKAKNLRTS